MHLQIARLAAAQGRASSVVRREIIRASSELRLALGIAHATSKSLPVLSAPGLETLLDLAQDLRKLSVVAAAV